MKLPSDKEIAAIADQLVQQARERGTIAPEVTWIEIAIDKVEEKFYVLLSDKTHFEVVMVTRSPRQSRPPTN